MRAVTALFLLVALTFAGCISGTDGESLNGTSNGTSTGFAIDGDAIDYSLLFPDYNWTGLDTSYPYHVLEEFCRNEESCTYWDGQYHEGVVYELDTLTIEAVVMPAPGVGSTQATEAAAQATAAWSLVEELTEEWFTDAWELNTYLVGRDVPSADAVQDPEIVVITEGLQRSTSIGLNAEQVACEVADVLTLETLDGTGFVPGTLAHYVYPVHEHHGMAVFAADCVTGGFRCVALNFASTALGGNNPLYDLVAHEVGHCIGLSHVGDALDFNTRFVPTPDIMAYADNPSRVSCPSNLNARVLEGIYAHLVDGQMVPAWITDGERLTMNPWDYETTECPLPPSGLL